MLVGQGDFALVEGAESQPGQVFQILCVLRCSLLWRLAGHEGGRCQHDAGHFSQADGDHGGVLHAADLDGAVDAFGDEVGAAVVQHPFHRHLGVAAQVVHQRRNQLVLPKGVRGHHAQGAAGRVGRAAQVVFHGGPAVQQLFGVGKAAVAVFGQLHHVG
ncbi:hypothetical protein D3C71_1487910 [compost metagenome]